MASGGGGGECDIGDSERPGPTDTYRSHTRRPEARLSHRDIETGTDMGRVMETVDGNRRWETGNGRKGTGEKRQGIRDIQETGDKGRETGDGRRRLR